MAQEARSGRGRGVKENGIDPFALLAYLRQPTVTEQVQQMVRGQTAHLHPQDLMELWVPDFFFEESSELVRLVQLLRQEVKLNSEMNRLAFEQIAALSALGTQADLRP